ncbi:hypothetical protein CCH79_00007086, partial [Gambusia affinis]
MDDYLQIFPYLLARASSDGLETSTTNCWCHHDGCKYFSSNQKHGTSVLTYRNDLRYRFSAGLKATKDFSNYDCLDVLSCPGYNLSTHHHHSEREQVTEGQMFREEIQTTLSSATTSSSLQLFLGQKSFQLTSCLPCDVSEKPDQKASKARSAFVHMDVDVSMNYDQVKLAVLQKYDINSETYRQRFRSLQVEPEETPKELYIRLKELYVKWVQPN